MRVAWGILLGCLLFSLLTVFDINRSYGASIGEQQMTWRVVGSGDSIMGMTLQRASPGGAVLTADHWIDTEYGRNAFTSGQANRASLASIWPLLVERSQRNGFIVIEDNGLGVSTESWRHLIRKIVAETPNDRTLVFIPPVFHWRWSAQNWNETVVRRQIMIEEAQLQPKRAIINWPGAVLGDPMMVYDGQHPSSRGRIWLQRALTAVTGLRP